MKQQEKIGKPKALPPVSDINVTPMVDVMLVMLIIFMVITPMMQHGIPLNLTPVRNPIPMAAADKTDAIVCAITHDGKTYLGTTQMQPEDLPPKVKDMLVNRTDRTVFVRSDMRARYERVVDVVDNLRAAGVDNIGLLTEQIQDRATPPPAGTPPAQ